MKKILTFLIVFWSAAAAAQSYEIYVSDAGNFSNPPWQILKFDQNGQNPVVFISSNLNWPQDIVFMEDSGQVLISNLGNGKISRYNSTDGTYISDFATGIQGPTRMKIGPDGLLYVLQWNGNGKVRRYELDGTYTGEFTSTGVPQSIGLDWDSSGRLYVSSYTGHYIRRFDNNGSDLGIFINTNLLGPTNIWFDANGDLLVSDYNGSSVNRYDSAGAYLGPFITGLGQSEGVAYLPGGNILIGNGATNSVKMFDSSGTYLQDLISSGSGNLLNPNAIYVRILSGTSLVDHEVTAASVLYPSAGNTFYISEFYRDKVESLYLFELTGKMIQRVDVKQPSKPIHMIGQPSGMLIVKIQLASGRVLYQRVIVTD